MFDNIGLSIMNPLFTMDGDWAIVTFVEKVRDVTQGWASFIITGIGVIMVVVGIIWIAKNLMGKNATPWALAIGTLFIGGAMAISGGYSIVKDMAMGQKQTLQELGHSIVIDGSDYLDAIETIDYIIDE